MRLLAVVVAVAAAAARFDTVPVPRLVGPKMHKTGSTTLGGILARAANRYGWTARLYGTIQPTDESPRFGPRSEPPEQPDVLYCHVVGSANLGNPSDFHWIGGGKKHTLRRIANYTFERFVGYAQYAVPGSRLVLALREPMARYVSMMNYFTFAETTASRDLPRHIRVNETAAESRVRRLYATIAPLAARGLGGEYQTTVLGLRSAAAATAFIHSDAFGEALLFVTSNAPESLVLIRRALAWAPEDILHLDVHVACADGVRWDGRSVACVDGGLNDVPEDVRRDVAALHVNDRILYAAARAAVGDRFRALGESGAEEAAAHGARKAALARYCARDGPSSTYRPEAADFGGDPCAPFLMNDASFPLYLRRPRPYFRFDGAAFYGRDGVTVPKVNTTLKGVEAKDPRAPAAGRRKRPAAALPRVPRARRPPPRAAADDDARPIWERRREARRGRPEERALGDRR